jgi:hypothetical protein
MKPITDTIEVEIPFVVVCKNPLPRLVIEGIVLSDSQEPEPSSGD